MSLHRSIPMLLVLVGCGFPPATDFEGAERGSGAAPAASSAMNGGGEDDDLRSTCDVAPDRAQEVLASRCSRCHGWDTPGYGGFDAVDDPVRLVAEGWVVPGVAGTSPVYVEIEGGAMPTTGPLGEAEVIVILEWIVCGAESWLAGTEDPTQGGSGPETTTETWEDTGEDTGEDDEDEDEDEDEDHEDEDDEEEDVH